MEGIEYYMSLPYTTELIQNEDGSFFAAIKELKGCMTEGETRAEALEMLDDAKEAWLEIALEDGKKIPVPTSMRGKEYSGKLNLRLPKHLHRDLANNAENEGISLNAYLIYLLSENNGIYNNQERIINHLSQKLYDKGTRAWKLSVKSKVTFPTNKEKAPKLINFPVPGIKVDEQKYN